MTDMEERIRRDFELFINEQSADLAILRVTFQIVLLRLFANTGDPITLLADLKESARAALENTQLDPKALSDAERHRQLTLMRADLFFRDMEDAIRLRGSSDGRSGSN